MRLIDSIIVMDNYIYDSHWLNSPTTAQLFDERRDLHLNIAICSPPICILPQTDWTFVFRENNTYIKKSLYEWYLDTFLSYSQFESLMDEHTDDRGCLVINNKNKKLYFYSASASKDVRLCCDELWELLETDQGV